MSKGETMAKFRQQKQLKAFIMDYNTENIKKSKAIPKNIKYKKKEKRRKQKQRESSSLYIYKNLS